MSDTKYQPKFSVLRNSYTNTYLQLLETSHRSVLNDLREKRYKPSELNLSRRVYSHWKKNGLLGIHSNDDVAKLSFLELFWAMIVMELRDFGLPLEVITKVRKTLFKNKKSVLFEGYLVQMLMQKRRDVYLLVADDGEIILGTRLEIETADMLGLIERNYIKINFNVVRNKLYKEKVPASSENPAKLFRTEMEDNILYLIRSGEYEEVKLYFENGAVTRIKKTSLLEQVNPFEELRNLIKSGGQFTDIEIKQTDGKFVAMKIGSMEKP